MADTSPHQDREALSPEQSVTPAGTPAWESEAVRPDEAADSIAELQAVLLDSAGLDSFLEELAVLSARKVTEGLSCGITLRPAGRPLTAASSDAFARQVDEIQYGIENGPCLSAMRTGTLVHVSDTAAEPRWGDFETRAAASGVGSSLSIPLTADGRHFGAMNLYAPVPHAFGQAELRRAEAFAATATGALTLAMRQAAQADLTAQLRSALASRAVIDQALGIIMAQQRCTAAKAFEILRAASQNRNIKLRDVAASIIRAVSGESPQPPPFSDPPDDQSERAR